MAKFNTTASGNASLEWSTYFGGSGEDQFFGIALTSQGVALAGFTQSLNYPTTNAFQATNGNTGGANRYDATATVVSASGSSLVYSTYLGGTGSDIA